MLEATPEKFDQLIVGNVPEAAESIERERGVAVAALQRSEEHFRLIAENTRDLICLLDLAENYIYAAPSYEAVLGYRSADLIGQPCGSIVHPSDAQILKKTLALAAACRHGCPAEIRYRHQNGAWLLFELVANLIWDDQGQPQKIVAVCRDISERKQAEEEIQQLAAFPRFNPNASLAFSSDGVLTYFNEAALSMANSLEKDHPKDILPLNTPMLVKRCLATGQKIPRLDTSMQGRTFSWSFFPIAASQVVHCYAEEITERLNLESQLRQSQKMESVGQLAAGVAHDFNNILTIIQGHACLLLNQQNLQPRMAESLKQISAAAERAATLTQQLLMFSRKQLMQPQLLNLNEVIRDVSKMLRTLLGEQINLQVTPARALPMIFADPGMMEQVIVNLAVNARDAISNGGALAITTEPLEIDADQLQRHAEARPGDFVCLKVADNGCGMSPETLARIFEPFFTTKEVGKGTGLGLATVYGIVQQHQGWIEVSSKPGVGTTFEIFFPASSKAQNEAEGDCASKSIPGGEETILVVEDEPALRELVKEVLERYGYNILEAATGAQALGVWEQHRDKIDLLLTDMMMPEGISGRELAVRVLAEKPDLKVIYTSGYSVDTMGEDFKFKEGLNYLQKPYQPPVLAQMVRASLDN